MVRRRRQAVSRRDFLKLGGGRTGEYELAAAGSLIMTVPVVILFLIFQKYFIRGLTAGAFK